MQHKKKVQKFSVTNKVDSNFMNSFLYHSISNLFCSKSLNLGKILILIIINLSALTLIAQKKANPWVFLNQSDDISVYYRISGNNVLRELKLITTSTAPLDLIASTLTNIDSTTKWAYLCKEVSIVKVISNVELYYYYVIKSPWPLNNRDLVIHMKVVQDSTTGIITINTQNFDGLVAKKNDYVRIKKMTGKWVLTPLKNGLVKMEYYILLNPSGNIPVWISNKAMGHFPIKSVIALKKIVEKRQE